MVSTPLKNLNQNGNLPQDGVKMENIWNHHLDKSYSTKKNRRCHRIFMAPFLRFCRCLVFLRNFAKRIICRSILFHGKIMHDSSASSILVHSILMGSHWVQPVFQIWTYPWILQKTTKRPHQGQTPSWLTSHGASCLFFSVENLADWLLNAHGWEVGCKFASSDVFFSGLLCWVAVGLGLLGLGC